eukprot:5005250-Pyramimonas_sp.AAC.2
MGPRGLRKPSWGSPWAVVIPRLGVRGQSWTLFWPSWGPLGPSCGRSLGCLGASKDQTGEDANN